MKNFIRLLLPIAVVLLTGRMLANDQDDLVRTKTFKIGSGGVLEVKLNEGDIRVTTWDKDEVFVKARGDDEDDLDDLDMRSSGRSVIVTSRNSESEISLDVTIPAKFDIDIRTSAGNLDIGGPLTGNLEGTTSAGDIRITSNVGGKVDMTTSGGNIRTGNVGGDLRLNTSGGDITLGDVSGDADVNTSGGNIRVENVKKTLWARTSGGDVMIGDVGGEATVSTSGGNVDVGKVSGSAKLSTAGGDINLDGASGDVQVKTAGGTLRLSNITGSIDARTAGGDISAELIPTGGVKSRLSTAAGTIRLELPENAKATIEARIRVQGSWWQSHDEYRIHSDFKSESYENDKEEQEIRATYILNGGGEPITLETVNADIDILKLRRHSK